MRQLTALFAAAMFPLLPSAVSARVDTGHMTVAAIAYHDLDSKTRDAVSAVLKDHPQYHDWTESYTRDKAAVPLAEYVFEQASTWPDIIRHGGSEYDHPNWHFIDYPVHMDATDSQVTPDDAPSDNILFGIKASEDILHAAESTGEQKAASLSWLIHLIADIHQPLHCATLKNAAFPKTDRGGTRYYVKVDGHTVRLHQFWDDLLGASITPDTAETLANDLIRDYPRAKLAALKTGHTPAAWSLESRAIALSDVYKDLNVLTDATSSAVSPLPDGYAVKATTIARRQTVIAGHRLAGELRQVLKPQSR